MAVKLRAVSDFVARGLKCLIQISTSSEVRDVSFFPKIYIGIDMKMSSLSLTFEGCIAKDNGPKRALILIESQQSFLDVSASSWSIQMFYRYP